MVSNLVNKLFPLGFYSVTPLRRIIILFILLHLPRVATPDVTYNFNNNNNNNYITLHISISNKPAQ